MWRFFSEFYFQGEQCSNMLKFANDIKLGEASWKEISMFQITQWD